MLQMKKAEEIKVNGRFKKILIFAFFASVGLVFGCNYECFFIVLANLMFKRVFVKKNTNKG